jgi:hypothetical protein
VLVIHPAHIAHIRDHFPPGTNVLTDRRGLALDARAHAGHTDSTGAATTTYINGNPSPHLANCLLEHAAARGAILPIDPLLRYRDGRPLTSRRHDHLWRRLGHQLPWVATHSISTHWLRRTTLTWVELR